MGPSCGLARADLGADAIEVEPVDGDRARRPGGSAAGLLGHRGAASDVCTEDLAFVSEERGLDTGIDPDRLPRWPGWPSGSPVATSPAR